MSFSPDFISMGIPHKMENIQILHINVDECVTQRVSECACVAHYSIFYLCLTSNLNK